VLDQVSYNAYGQVTAETNAAAGDAYKYNGGWQDAQTGLVKFGERWYNPATGSWTTRDPIAFGGGDYNTFRYVGNSPTIFVDATGLSAEDVVPVMLRSDSGKGGKPIPGERVLDRGNKAIETNLKLGGKDAIAVAVKNVSFQMGAKKAEGIIRFGVASEDADVIKKARWLQFIKWDKPAVGGPPCTAVKDDAGGERYFPFNQWHVDTGNKKDPFYDSGPKSDYRRTPLFVIISDRPIGPADPGNPTYTGEGATFLVYNNKIVWYAHWKFRTTRGAGGGISVSYPMVTGGATAKTDVIKGLDHPFQGVAAMNLSRCP
jgi:RHS repeat-associated protein